MSDRASDATTDAGFSFAGIRPDVRGEEEYYFDRCQEGRLVIQRCNACEAHVFYPRSVCPHCWSLDLDWVDADGTGTVFTYTVQNREPAGFEGQAPYVLAMVELTEGVRLMARVLCDPDKVRIEMPVRVDFAKIDDDFQVPVFVPAEGDSRG